MLKFQKQTQIFLAQVGVTSNLQISIVPKSISCAQPGDILIFRYQLYGPPSERIFMVTEPIVKGGRAGNLLLTGFKVPEGEDYTPNSLISLYENRELPEEGYRTYIMSKIYGPLRKIKKV